MFITVTATKGGAGATTVAATIGLAAPDGATLVDLTGDLAAAIGAGDDQGVGVADWLTSDAPVERLDELVVEVDRSSSVLLPHGSSHEAAVSAAGDRWSLLLDWCDRRSASSAAVVVDAGSNTAAVRGADHAGHGIEVLVTRACFLALRRRGAGATTPQGVVLIGEPGRSLGPRDVERTLGAPVLATMPWDPTVARAIDAGLAVSSLPRTMRRTGRTVWRALGDRQVRRWTA